MVLDKYKIEQLAYTYSMIDIDQLYTRQEVEQFLGLKKRAVVQLVKNGVLNPIVLGNKYRFRGKTILEFLDQKEATAQQDRRELYEKKLLSNS